MTPSNTARKKGNTHLTPKILKSKLTRRLIISLILVSLVCFASYFFWITYPPAEPTNTTRILFIEDSGDISFDEENRRKFTIPLVGDFDSDGYLDLLLNDHGEAIHLFWNNQGKFKTGIELVKGDIHGASVGDFNSDGSVNIILSMGGGGGDNPNRPMVFSINRSRKVSVIAELDKYLPRMRGRSATFFDGDNDGDLDLILVGGPLQLQKRKSNNFVYENVGEGHFRHASTLPRTHDGTNRIKIIDYNNDGIEDLIFYGRNQLKIFRGGSNLDFEEVTRKVTPHPINRVEAIAEIDFDNDGDFDLYVSRSQKLESGETFHNEERSLLGFYLRRGTIDLKNLPLGDTAVISNFDSTHFDKNIYLGKDAIKARLKGPIHTGKNLAIEKKDALGWPTKMDKSGLHLGYTGNGQWRLGGRATYHTSGAIHNVKDYQGYTHPPKLKSILLENVNGKFVNSTKNTGLNLLGNTTGVAVADFDNNGYHDIFVLNRGDMVTDQNELLFLNNGRGYFNPAHNHGIVSSEIGAIGLAAEAFDYNLDGKMDVMYCREKGKWHLQKNISKIEDDFNYILLNIGKPPDSMKTELGATVTIQACGNTQKKRVGSTSGSYSRSNINMVHFGLGTCNKVDRILVKWSNGEELVKTQLKPNSIYKVGE